MRVWHNHSWICAQLYLFNDTRAYTADEVEEVQEDHSLAIYSWILRYRSMTMNYHIKAGGRGVEYGQYKFNNDRQVL